MMDDRFLNSFKEPGSYLLGLRVPERATVQIGKLGTYIVSRGYYVYSGSARGPGGLAGRLRHHLGPAPAPHWHIDYLKTIGYFEDIWVFHSVVKLECRMSITLVTAGFVRVIGKFGSSDCRCPGHLLHWPVRRSVRRKIKTVLDLESEIRWKHYRVSNPRQIFTQFKV